MAQERNVCAGPFGAIYDFYIERPLLARLIFGAMWGVDPRTYGSGYTGPGLAMCRLTARMGSWCSGRPGPES
jgi:hypothetical protein